MRIEYDSIGRSKDLQMKITNFLAKRAVAENKTLDELGYFHMNSVLFNGSNVEIKLYFHPSLALTEEIQPNGNKKFKLKGFFKRLSGYLFIGDAAKMSKVEKMSVPRYKIITDDNGKKTLLIKDKLDERESEVLVINCNVDMTMAAIHDVSLLTDGFNVAYNSIGTDSKKRPIMVSASSDVYPIELVVEWNEHGDHYEYDPSEVEEYFQMVIDENIEREKKEKKIARKAIEDKGKKNKLYKSYEKFR